MKIDIANRNSEGMAPCKHCLSRKKKLVYPKIVEIDDLYYAQCPKCHKSDAYEFLGCLRKRTIENCNIFM